jgi:hypothetical protein
VSSEDLDRIARGSRRCVSARLAGRVRTAGRVVACEPWRIGDKRTESSS